MEVAIKRGDAVFIKEIDRLFLKNIIEHSGETRDLSVIRGAANLSQQSEDLVRVFSVQSLRNQGCDGVIGIVTNAVLGSLEYESGNVFEKGKKITDVENESVSSFIDDFFTIFYDKEFEFIPTQYENGSWKRKTMYRIEVVLAVTNKLLWILVAKDEEEAKRRQDTPGVLKHLRERILRGLEREGEIVSPEIARFNDEEVIRHLPKDGLANIMGTLVRM